MKIPSPDDIAKQLVNVQTTKENKEWTTQKIQ
jgi:hypothetical protein